jgi:EAL and modified HD-GYP domain-containing signal transduction protein
MSALAEARNVAVVRQPIVDARHAIVGYELRFAGEQPLFGDAALDAKATSALLVNAFGDIGLDVLTGRHPGWMAVARTFLAEIGPPPVRPDRAVLLVEPDEDPDGLAALLGPLVASGYTFALDGYDGDPALARLAEQCAIVRVDVTGRDVAWLARAAAASPAAVLTVAAGVEDHAAFEHCRAAGFAYFQGEFFAKPRIVVHRGVGTGGVASLRTLGELCAADASFEDLERIISADVGLSVKLLRYVNSAFFSLPRTIGSVREALTLLGKRTVRRWATVIAMSGIVDAPHDLVALALQRARMCEMLAGTALPEEREALFTVGLFSVVDGLLSAPMADVLESLPFSDEIRSALLDREGPKGELLATVLAYERGEFPALPAALGGGRAADPPVVGGAYRAALEWADEAGRAFA